MSKQRNDYNCQLIESQLSLVEAIANLSHLADLRIAPLSPDKQEPLTPQDQMLVQEALHHLRSSQGGPMEGIRETFQSLYLYLSDFYGKRYAQLSQTAVRQNFRHLFAMIGQAARKLDRCNGLFQTVHRASDLAEYRHLEIFVQSKLAKPLGEPPGLRLEQIARNELGDLISGSGLSLHPHAGEDLQHLVSDADYELYFLKREDNSPFFTPELLRNLQVIHQFDSSPTSLTEADPLLELRELLDAEAHQRCRHLLNVGRPYWDLLVQRAGHEEDGLWSLLYQMMTAFMLGGNSRNLLAALPVKSSLSYFRDGLHYLTKALQSPIYHSCLLQPHTPKSSLAVGIIHEVCQGFFLYPAALDSMVPYINKLIRRGTPERVHEREAGLELLSEEQAIRQALSAYPSGPLLRMLDFVQLDDIPVTFHPLVQENWPGKLWTLRGKGFNSIAMRLPSPTEQTRIDHAQLSPLFTGFLRSYDRSTGPQKHLLINLQNPLCFRDRARCLALEQATKSADLDTHFDLLTLPKAGDFYFQVGDYCEDRTGQAVLSDLIEQICGGQEFGFQIPAKLHPQLRAHMEQLASTIDQGFMPLHTSLDRDHRLVLIELFHHLFVEWAIEHLRPDSFSFTDKDSVDTAAAAAGLFYLLHHWNADPGWTPGEAGLLESILFGPALMLRERMISPECMARLAQTAYYAQTRRLLHFETIAEAA